MLILTGCSTQSGMVTGATPQTWAAGPKVPKIIYTSARGQELDFNKTRYPVTIVVFSAPKGENCCWIDPRVASLWDRLRDLPVTVAQFSLPTRECPHGPGCVEGCNIRGGLMTICDPDRTAWAAFGRPPIGTMILIERGNQIAMTGSLQESQAVVAEARRLGQAETNRRVGERIEMYK